MGRIDGDPGPAPGDQSTGTGDTAKELLDLADDAAQREHAINQTFIEDHLAASELVLASAAAAGAIRGAAAEETAAQYAAVEAAIRASRGEAPAANPTPAEAIP